MMRCLFCGAGPSAGLFRVNAKGQPGRWACSKHINQTDSKPDAELADLVAVIGRKARQPGTET
jgi:predicted metal-binding protein